MSNSGRRIRRLDPSRRLSCDVRQQVDHQQMGSGPFTNVQEAVPPSDRKTDQRNQNQEQTQERTKIRRPLSNNNNKQKYLKFK